MAPPKYKLTYFDSRGIVEPLRLMFAYKKVTYDDVRIKKEDWPGEFKAKTPFGKLPTLEFDGHVLSESKAISRYIAKELDLYGKTSLEAATIDMYLDALKDCFNEIRTFRNEEDALKKAEAATKFITETFPPFLDKMENYLKKNGGKFYVGDSLTLADFSFAYIFNEIQVHNAAVFEKYPEIFKHIDDVHALPQIKAWVDKRPKSQNKIF